MTSSGPSRPQYDFEYVAGRLSHAGMTLMALQVNGLRPATFRSNMPQPVGTIADDHRPSPPSPKAIGDMDQALSWIKLIPEQHLLLRRLVSAVALTSPITREPFYSWRQLGRWLRCDHKTAKARWERGIWHIVRQLNQPGLCGQPAFVGTRPLSIKVLEAAAAKSRLAPVDMIRELEDA